MIKALDASKQFTQMCVWLCVRQLTVLVLFLRLFSFCSFALETEHALWMLKDQKINNINILTVQFNDSFL